MINWNGYLESLNNIYSPWETVYTLTDVATVLEEQDITAKKSHLSVHFEVKLPIMPPVTKLDFQEVPPQPERLNAIAGLRKYAANHVLLMGRAGSGKSTTLIRFLWEESKKRHSVAQATPLQIPVLVELKYYQNSVLELIQNVIHQHDPNLELNPKIIQSSLYEGQLLLLFDGVNELPSEQQRLDLQVFRVNYRKTTPMIFTTRDSCPDSDLNIDKKLEIQPMTELQIRQFIHSYLPKKDAEQMLKELKGRFHEFGETPLMLMMLCYLYKTMGKIPPNLGLVFRQFQRIHH